MRKLTRKQKKKLLEILVAIILVIFFGFFDGEETESPTEITQAPIVTSTPERIDNSEEVITGENEVKTTYSKDKLEVYFFDVGQADCILLRTGKKVMLIDCGNAGDADLHTRIKNKINLTHELARLGIEKIHSFVITHAHEDHMGSAYKILKMFDVDTLYANALLPEEEQAKYYERFVEALENSDTHFVSPTVLSEKEIKAEIEEYNAELIAEYEAEVERLKKEGKTEELEELPEPELLTYHKEDYIWVLDKIPFGDANITMIAPNSEEYSDINDTSIVLMVEFDGVNLLLTGDASKQSEEEILKMAAENQFDLDCDVLKVGHHGSRTASMEAFIEAISPEYAIVMVAEENSYGLPDEDVLERLERHGTVVYQTKDEGDIKLTIDDGQYEFDFSYSHEVKSDEDAN